MTNTDLAQALADITDEATYEATLQAAADLRTQMSARGSVAQVMAARQREREARERRREQASR